MLPKTQEQREADAKARARTNPRFRQIHREEQGRLHPESMRELRQLALIHGTGALRIALDLIDKQDRS